MKVKLSNGKEFTGMSAHEKYDARILQAAERCLQNIKSYLLNDEEGKQFAANHGIQELVSMT